MEISVLPRFIVERGFCSEYPYVLISITDPRQTPANLPEDPYRKDVLRLEFHDLTEPLPGYPEVFAEEHAQKIVTFLRDVPWDTHVIVHCEAGVSRSAGVAAGIAQWRNCDKEQFYKHPYHPNPLVVRILSRACAREQVEDNKKRLGEESVNTLLVTDNEFETISIALALYNIHGTQEVETLIEKIDQQRRGQY
jgi:predicted protein tyrosine phosphatase